MDALTIHKRYRVCRRHFDADCLNGGCRRLLNTAIPTLYLDAAQTSPSSKKVPDIIYLPGDEDESEEHFALIVSDTQPTQPTKEIKCKCEIIVH